VLNKLAGAITAAEKSLADLPRAPDQTRARDDASRAVEDVMFTLEDVGKLGPATGLIAGQSEVDAWQTLADAVREGTTDGAGTKLAALRSAVSAELASKAADVVGGDSPETLAKVAAIEAAVGELMPMPTDAAGARTSVRLLLGTDASGRSIFLRGIYSAKTAIQVGVIVALAAVLIGALLGSAAAYFGGWIDILVTWCYSTLSSLPQLVLLAVLAFMFLNTRWETTLVPIYVALTLTFWIGPARVIRGEVLKIKELEYVQAGKAIGFSRPYILIRHIIPNTSHLMFINFSLLFIGAVKTEVILTFLGLGVKEGASWGRMISDAASEVVNGVFWQIGAATFFMLVLVLAFNVVSDALQDAFDPRHVG
jgi:peptide/nickel transport system permease protein